MRPMIILIIACAALFDAFVNLAGDHGRPVSTDVWAHPPEKPDWVLRLGTLTAPFAPKLKLEGSPFSLAASESRQFPVPPSSESGRVARFLLTSGYTARVIYDCKTAERKNCRQTLCLLGPHTPHPADCPGTPSASGSVLVYNAGGVLTLQSAEHPVVIESH